MIAERKEKAGTRKLNDYQKYRQDTDYLRVCFLKDMNCVIS